MKKQQHFPSANIAEAMADPKTFGPWFEGDSWNGWRAVLKAAFALPMTDEEIAFFHEVAEREPPRKKVSELWIIAGRGAGKDSIASAIVAHVAALFARPEPVSVLARAKSILRRGERARVMALAADREQAKIVLNLTRQFFSDVPALKRMVTRETASGFELSNNVDIAINTNSYRSTRGFSILAAIFDEVAFWRDDTSSTPDEETYNSILPGLARVPGSMLIGISTPWRKSGLLYRKFAEHYGKDSDDVLVIRASSMTMNPTLPMAQVQRAIAENPAKARAEWYAEFRNDLDGYVADEVIEACTIQGRYELPHVRGQHYIGFVDSSGGSSDSMTLGLAHRRGIDDKLVLDLLREVKAPFSPEVVVEQFVAILKSYGVREVIGDNYASQWVQERFRKAGIKYKVSSLTKSELFMHLLHMLNAREVELLDIPRLRSQFATLSVVPKQSGREAVEKMKGSHDDLANAAAGALVWVQQTARTRVHYSMVAVSFDGNGPDLPVRTAESYEQMKVEAQRLEDQLWRPTPPQYATVENPNPVPPPQAPTQQGIHPLQSWTDVTHDWT